jgi:ABC-type phosphate/phosphonate transport system substrate-binding protein
VIAHLGMYDIPALQGANDRFWGAIRARLGHGPGALTRGVDFWAVWTSPDLLLAQTCGMPFRTGLHGQVALVGTPDHRLSGCGPGYYCSVLVVRENSIVQAIDDLQGGVLAYNDAMSQSGWAAPMSHFNDHEIAFSRFVQSGGHAASAQMVTRGEADVAGLDAVTWELLKEHDPVAADLRVLAVTVPTPALPYITRPGGHLSDLRAAVAGAIADLTPQDRAALHLHGLASISKQTYLAVPTPPGPQEATKTA